MKYIAIIIFICFAPIRLLCLDQQSANIDSKLADVKNKTKKLEQKINKLSNKITSIDNTYSSVLQELTDSVSTISYKIKRLKKDFEKEFEDIDDLQTELSTKLDSTNSELSARFSESISMINTLAQRSNTLDSLIEYYSNKLNTLPDIFFKNLIPPFSLSVNGQVFLNNKNNVTVKPCLVFEPAYRINENTKLWFSYHAPFEFIASGINSATNEYIETNWVNSIYNLGCDFNLKRSGRFECNYGIGCFLGYSKLKVYYLTNREYSQLEYVGLNPRLSISYNQFDLKNSVEFFIALNGFLSNKKIVLQTASSDKFDFGVFLMSFSFGVKLNFW